MKKQTQGGEPAAKNRGRGRTTNKGAGARLISLLLALVLVVTMVPALAFAGGEEQPIAPATEEGTGGTPSADTPAEDGVSGEALTLDTSSNLDTGSANTGTETPAGGSELQTASTTRIASEVKLDKAVTPYEIALTDAASIESVKIGESDLIPLNVNDVIEEGEEVEWWIKDNNTLVLANTVVNDLAVGTHTLKLTFADGTEETSELKLIDSSAIAAAGGVSVLGGDISILAAGDLAGTTFAGQSMSGASDSVSFTAGTIINTAQTLHIDANFDPGATSKKITINIPQGLGIYSGDGLKVASGSTNRDNWEYDASALTDLQKSRVTGVTWTQADTLKRDDTSVVYQPRHGTLVYEIDPGCDSIVLDILITADYRYMMTETDLVISDVTSLTGALEVTTGQSTGGDSAKMEEVIAQCDYLARQNQADYKEVVSSGSSWEQYYNIVFQVEGYSHWSQNSNFFMDEAQVTLVMPSDAGMTSIKPLSGSSIKASDIISTSLSSSGGNDYLTVVFRQYADFSNPRLVVEGTLKDSLTVGTRYAITTDSTTTNSYFKTVWGETLSFPTGGISQPGYVEVAANDNLLTVAGATARIHPDEVNTGAAMSKLGLFNVRNLNAVDLVNKRATLTFDATGNTYQVYAANLMCGVEGATNIRVTTNLRPGGFAVDDVAVSTNYTNGNSKFAFLSLASSLGQGEWITSISYDMGTIEAGAYPNDYLFNSDAKEVFFYYGKLIAAQTFSASISFEDTVDNSLNQTAVSRSTSILSGDTNYIPYESYGSGGGNLEAGTKKTLQFSVTRYGYRYDVNATDSYTGIVFYLRQPDGIKILEDSIKVTQGGVAVTDRQITYSTDIDGKPVIVVTCPNVVWGRYTASGGVIPSPQITVDVEASKTARAGYIHLADIFGATSTDPNDDGISNYQGGAREDVYNLAGQGTSKYIARPISGSTGLTIIPKAGLYVTTAAAGEDNNYKAYDGTDASIVDLIAGEGASYQVTVTNNTGEDISGYEVIIPIPKDGKTVTYYNSTTATFTWPVTLTGAITPTSSSSINYTVYYSTDPNYNMTKEGTWLTTVPAGSWGDVTAVRLVTTDKLDKDATADEVITFPIAVPSGAIADTFAGKVNTYSSTIYTTSSMAGGYEVSEQVAIRLSPAYISGTVKSVKDPAAAFATGNNVSGIVVKAYLDDGTGNKKDNVVQAHDTTALDGSYTLSGLLGTEKYILEFENPYYDDYSSGKPLATALKYVDTTGYTVDSDNNIAVAKTGVQAAGSASPAVVNLTMLAPMSAKFVYGASNVVHETQVVFYGDIVTEPSTDPDFGSNYELEGWYKDSAYATAWTFASDKILADETLIYAKQRGKLINVTFYANYPTDTNPDASVLSTVATYRVGDTITPYTPTPTTTGYTAVAGEWYTSPTTQNASTKYDFASAIVTAADVKLYAKWTANEYTLTYHKNTTDSGSTDASPISKQVSYNSQIGTLPAHGDAGAPTRPGYTLVGWSYSSGDTNTVNVSATDAWAVAGPQTIYAVWSANAYTLTFDKNHADAEDGTTTSIQVEFGKPVGTLPSGTAGPSRTGYELLGWADSATATNPNVNATTQWLTAGSGTYYAVWRAKTVAVTYDTDGGNTFTPAVGSTSTSYGSVITPNPGTPTKDGYTFESWVSSTVDPWVFATTTATAANGVTGAAGASPALTLTAKWTAKTVAVTYVTDGDTFTPASGSTSTSYGSPIATNPGTPTKEGYTFKSWVTSTVDPWEFGAGKTPATTVNGVANASTSPTLTLTATWTAKTVAVTYDTDGGNAFSPAAGSTTTTYGGTVSNPGTPTKDGYTFDRWISSGVDPWVFGTTEATTLNGVTGATGASPALTLTAKWTAKNVAVTYSTDGDSFTPASGSTSTRYDSPIATDPGVPTKDGYTFKSWTTSTVSAWEFGAGKTIANAANGVANASTSPTLTLTATWTPNPYTITYKPNGGLGSDQTQNVTFDASYNVYPASTYSRTGYNFAGWNTEPNGSGTGYIAGASKTYDVVGNLTLHAQWDSASGIAYRVEHYTVGTSGTPALYHTENRTGTTNQTVNASAISIAGHTYNGSYAGTVASGAVKPDGSLVLRLYYTINYYTVNFLDWNGSMLAQRSVAYGNSALAPVDPTRLGHTFTGWDRGYTNITSNITVNATYTPLTFTVTFLGYNDTVLQTSTVSYGDSATPPANPTRTGFRFAGWDKPSSAWTNVTADATVRATWNDQNTTTTPVTVEEPGDGGGGTTTIAEDMAAAAEEQGIPNIGIPLAAPTGFAAWALANLILATLGIVMALVFFVLRRFRKNDEVDEQEREERKRAYAEQAQWTNANGEEVEEEPLRKRRGIGWLIGCIVLALAGVVLFILTQDISLPMVWVDIWTIVQAIILIVSVVLGNFAIGRKRQKQEEDEPTAPEAV